MIKQNQTGAEWHRGWISDYTKGLFALAARIGLNAGDSDEAAERDSSLVPSFMMTTGFL